jgi:Bacterial type III secretion protein (HrpB4)
MNGHNEAVESVIAEYGDEGCSATCVAGETSAAVAARIAGHHRRRRTLFEWMHPLRLAGVPCADRLASCRESQAAALAEAFLDKLGMPVPSLDSFQLPGAALAILPASECLMVFRLRALVEHTEELRTWIDRPRRALLTEWIGARGVRLLFDRRRALAGLASDGRSVAARGGKATQPGKPQLAGVHGEFLAGLGFRLFERECEWPHDGPLAIMQLAMPPDVDAHAGKGLPPPAHGSNASLSIVSQLPDLFPEWSW